MALPGGCAGSRWSGRPSVLLGPLLARACSQRHWRQLEGQQERSNQCTPAAAVFTPLACCTGPRAQQGRPPHRAHPPRRHGIILAPSLDSMFWTRRTHDTWDIHPPWRRRRPLPRCRRQHPVSKDVPGSSQQPSPQDGHSRVGDRGQVTPAQGLQMPKVCSGARQTWPFQKASPQLARERGWGRQASP